MPTASPPWPKPTIFEKKFVVSAWEAGCMVADILGVPHPPRPAVDELLTAKELAAKLKCSPETAVRRLRARAAADLPADAPEDRAA